MLVQGQIDRINTEVQTQANLLSQIQTVLKEQGAGDADITQTGTPLENNTAVLSYVLETLKTLKWGFVATEAEMYH